MPEMIRPAALRVIVPVLPGADTAAAVPIAADLAGTGGHVVLLAIVPPPREGDLATATATARAARRTLRGLARLLPDGPSHDESVRAETTLLAGIRQVAREGADLLVLALPPDPAALRERPYASLISAPVCDTVFVRPGTSTAAIRSALVSARGGPHAELALEVAQRLTRARGAALTVLHVDVPSAQPDERQHEQRMFQSLVARSADAPRLRTSSVPAESAEQAVLAETARHDVLIVGARVTADSGSAELGAVPLAALQQSAATVLIVKPGRAVNPAIFRARPAAPDELVNTWFVENTLHCRDFAALDELTAQKRRAGLTLGVALLAGWGADSVAAHARVLLDDAALAGLIDEVVLFGGPDPALAEAAAAADLRFHAVERGGPEARGVLMQASLQRLRSDLIVWIDADIRNPHPKLVYGLAGPLIQDERLQLTKGFFSRPAQAPEEALEVLAGEFGARPLLNLFFPHLAGVIAPLSVEQAIRRASALALPMVAGSAAPLGILLDTHERFGLHAIAQVALEQRIARPVDLAGASRLAFSAAQVVAARAGALPEPLPGERPPGRIRLIHQEGDGFTIDELAGREAEIARTPASRGQPRP